MTYEEYVRQCEEEGLRPYSEAIFKKLMAPPTRTNMYKICRFYGKVRLAV
jgi:hypothetical protein